MKNELKGKNNKKRMARTAVIVTGTLLIVVSIVLIILFLLRGNTATTSEKIENIKITALNCDSKGLQYPFFTYDNSNERDLNIKMTFNEDILGNIALEYSLIYDDQDYVKMSEARNHAAMNISYGKNNLQSDSFNTKYTISKNKLRMNLYANKKEINEVSAKYFLINSEIGLPSTLEEYRRNYVAQGLVCEVTE